jgi:hypothetical protein
MRFGNFYGVGEGLAQSVNGIATHESAEEEDRDGKAVQERKVKDVELEERGCAMQRA